MTPARLAAARALLAIEAGQTTLAAEVEAGRAGLTDRRDRALLLDLVAGTLRWRNALDAIVAATSGRALTDMDDQARAVLRMGAYQLRYLDRVPGHAVVNESVETVKALGRARAAGFVNAVLRRLAGRPDSVALPARPSESSDRAAALAYLSITLSHPEWLVSRWLDRYGFEAVEAWCTFNNSAPDVTIRPTPGTDVDRLRAALEGAGIVSSPGVFVEDALRLPPGALGRVADDLRPLIVIQDEGAQLVARVAAASPGERVLDLCGAPGGKTLVMATDLAGSGLLVACDYRRARIRLLRTALGPFAGPVTGAPPRIVQLDASRPLPFRPEFDCVLIDVPCSGLGTLRRDPDLKWSRAEADLPRFAALQHAILTQAAEAVRPGGRLVYATCSSEPEENAERVRAFLAADTRFHQVPVARKGTPLDAAGALTTRPDQHGLDAFYGAVLVRRAGT